MDLWKSALRSRVEEFGLSNVSNALKRQGCGIAEEHNVANWMRVDTIAPQNIEQTFIPILKYLNLEGRVTEILLAVRSIKAAHLQAGKKMQENLLTGLRARNMAECLEVGFQIFSLADGPASKAIYLIERIGDLQMVSENQLGIVFERKA